MPVSATSARSFSRQSFRRATVSSGMGAACAGCNQRPIDPFGEPQPAGIDQCIHLRIAKERSELLRENVVGTDAVPGLGGEFVFRVQRFRNLAKVAFAQVTDFVIVVNADKLNFTGKKWEQKKYYWHTGYPGGIKSITAEDLSKKHPEDIIKKAVWGMLPKNKWQKKLITRLKIYTGKEHPHAPQKPETLEV